MTLFFETAAQANVFLAMLPLGLALAACFDIASFLHAGRPFWDALGMLLCGAAVAGFLMWSRAEGLRVYHLLALALGGVLYFHGLGRLLRWGFHKLRAHRKKKQKSAAP